MEAHTALVRADGGIELDAVAVVHLYLTLVIHPGDAEEDAPFRGGQPLKQRIAAVGILVLFDYGTQAFQHFVNSLIELRLVRILCLHSCQNIIYITHIQMSSLGRKICGYCNR
jgi:hypothetical protein